MPRIAAPRAALATIAALLLALAAGCEPRRSDPQRPGDPARPPMPTTAAPGR